MSEQVPKIVTTPPGPRTKEIMAKLDPILYPGLAKDLGPFIMKSKSGWQIEDVDGNVYLDMLSAMASVPLGSARHDLI
jgi:4-aminobutyrate aminotransferase